MTQRVDNKYLRTYYRIANWRQFCAFLWFLYNFWEPLLKYTWEHLLFILLKLKCREILSKKCIYIRHLSQYCFESSLTYCHWSDVFEDLFKSSTQTFTENQRHETSCWYFSLSCVSCLLEWKHSSCIQE